MATLLDRLDLLSKLLCVELGSEAEGAGPGYVGNFVRDNHGLWFADVDAVWRTQRLTWSKMPSTEQLQLATRILSAFIL